MHAGKRIVEIPIPTYYGDEICYVDGLRYARDVVRDVVEYRLAAVGFGTPQWVSPPSDYALKLDEGSSHSVVVEMLSRLPPSRVLDLGCSAGVLSEQVRALGHHVTGVDAFVHPDVTHRVDRFVEGDLRAGIPPEAGSMYDVVIAADVIEHLPDPAGTLRQMLRLLRPGGQIVLSVPNFVHWYPRLRFASGTFSYDRRGILDETHLRFFTRRMLIRLVRSLGFDVLEERVTRLPLGVMTPGEGTMLRRIRRWDARLVRLWPNLFGYQNILRLTPHAEDEVHVEVV